EQEMRNRPDHGEDSYRGFNRLHDRVALITGGDSGIGKAVAIANAREGAHVDDDPAIRNYIKTVLERAGIQVLEAVDGVAALALYQSLSRSFRSGHHHIRMPRMRGDELAMAIRSESPTMPVIFISGDPDNGQ